MFDYVTEEDKKSNKEVKMDEIIKEEERLAKEEKKETTVSTSEEVAPKEEATEKALADMTLAELKAVAKERGIKGYSTMKKDDLISVLK